MQQTPATEHVPEATHAEVSSIHLPGLQGEAVEGWNVAGVGITNTIVSTWAFMTVLFVVVAVFNVALRSNVLPRWRDTGLAAVRALDDFIVGLMHDRDFARKFFPIIAGFFVTIVLSNVLSLGFDWLVLSSSHEWLAAYLRPVNSDLNTTLAMAAIVMVIAQGIAIAYRGPVGYLRGYLFDFSGANVAEKCINTFVGWLHLIGEVTRLLSLSFRLFGNIFAGVVLISVMSFLLGKLEVLSVPIGQLGVLPFWFFELFVAAIQAFIFFILTGIYFSEARTTHGHEEHSAAPTGQPHHAHHA